MMAKFLILFFVFSSAMSYAQSGVTIIDTTICSGDSIQLGDDFYETNGNYYHTYTNVNGDDSLVVLSLNVVDLNVNTFFANNNIQVEVNLPNASLNYLDCDNNFVLSNPPSSLNTGYLAIEATLGGCKDTSACTFYNYLNVDGVCQGDVTVIGEITLGSLPGQFTFHFIDNNGLDSVIVVNLLNVLPLASVQYSADAWTIFAQPLFSVIDGWYDCETQELVQGGGNEFTPEYSGSFCASYWQACPNFSECFDFQFVSIHEQIYSSVFKTYPNPFSNQFTIESETTAGYVITDIFGKEVSDGEIIAGKNLISLDNQFGSGLYFVSISTGELNSVYKLLKEIE